MVDRIRNLAGLRYAGAIVVIAGVLWSMASWQSWAEANINSTKAECEKHSEVIHEIVPRLVRIETLVKEILSKVHEDEDE